MQTSDERDLRDIEQHVAHYRRRHRPAQRIGDVLSGLMARRGYAQVQAGVELQQNWAQIVGDSLANHSQPTRLRRGVLQIVVRNSIVLQELTFRKAELLRRVQETDQAVRDMRFQIGPL